MLEAYRGVFFSFPDLTSLLALLADPNSSNLFALYVMPVIMWVTLKGVSSQAKEP
jgi:hypothetical protein